MTSSQSQTNTPSILGLPRELRDQILDLVVLTEQPAPLDAHFAETDNRRELHDMQYMSRNSGANVEYIGNLAKPELFPTLFVNRQLRLETLAAIERLPTKYTYKVDIMVVDEHKIWPTWLSVPDLCTKIDTVHASFRIFNLGKRYPDRWSFFIRDSVHSRPEAAWCFYSLLERFLKLGPSTTSPIYYWETERRKTCIKHLDLDIITPDVSKYEIAADDCVGWDREAHQLMNPAFLSRFLKTQISRLLSYTVAESIFGAIVYEQVGAIRLFRDGKLEEEWDLAEMLDSLLDDGVNEDRNLTRGPCPNEEWKVDLFETRVKHGLPVVLSAHDCRIGWDRYIERKHRQSLEGEGYPGFYRPSWRKWVGRDAVPEENDDWLAELEEELRNIN